MAPWIVALHDIGKISVPFQAKSLAQRQRLEAEGVSFGHYASEHRALHHTLMGCIGSDEWAKELPYGWRKAFLAMVAGHHGRYQAIESSHWALAQTLAEPPEWAAWRAAARDVLRRQLLHGELPKWPEPDNVSAAIAALNGFVILCDWLGSDSDYFAPQPLMPLAEYQDVSWQKAGARAGNAGFFSLAEPQERAIRIALLK